MHDLHVWTLTSGMNVATAHLVAGTDGGRVLGKASLLLRERFGIAHATLQVETRDRKCQNVDW